MGAQRVSERLVRACRRATGLDVVAAWNHPGRHDLAIVTTDHRHGWWDRRQNTVTFDPNWWPHYSSCKELFPPHGFGGMSDLEVLGLGTQRAGKRSRRLT